MSRLFCTCAVRMPAKLAAQMERLPILPPIHRRRIPVPHHLEELSYMEMLLLLLPGDSQRLRLRC